MKFLTSLLVLALFASPLSATVWVDDFSGATLATTNFNTPTTSGNLQFQANGAQSRVEIISTGVLAGVSHNNRWDHQQTIAYNSAWVFAADVFSGDILDLSLNVVSSLDASDQAQFNFVTGDPFGSVIHGARFAKRTNDADYDQVIDGALGTGTLAGSISMHFNPNTNIIAAFYNFGSGSPLLGSTNISEWNMTSGTFSFFIESAATNINPPDDHVIGAISIPAGSLYLDEVILATPEPSRVVLLMAGAFATLLRRRRNA